MNLNSPWNYSWVTTLLGLMVEERKVIVLPQDLLTELEPVPGVPPQWGGNPADSDQGQTVTVSRQ